LNARLYSIHYSYEEIFPTKGAIKSQIPDMDEDMISNTKYRYTKSSPYLKYEKQYNNDIRLSNPSEEETSLYEVCINDISLRLLKFVLYEEYNKNYILYFESFF